MDVTYNVFLFSGEPPLQCPLHLPGRQLMAQQWWDPPPLGGFVAKPPPTRLWCVQNAPVYRAKLSPIWGWHFPIWRLPPSGSLDFAPPPFYWIGMVVFNAGLQCGPLHLQVLICPLVWSVLFLGASPQLWNQSIPPPSHSTWWDLLGGVSAPLRQ